MYKIYTWTIVNIVSLLFTCTTTVVNYEVNVGQLSDAHYTPVYNYVTLG